MANKYHNVITECDGIKFRSAKEANRYKELKLLLRAGEITELELQPVFVLEPSCVLDGRKQRCRTYTADFRYTDKNGVVTTEDCKGMRTKDYRYKRHCMKTHFNIDVLET